MGSHAVTLSATLLLLLAQSPFCFAKHANDNCTKELDAAEEYQAFSCQFDSDYNLTIKANDSHSGIFLKLTSIHLEEKDEFLLLKNVSGKVVHILRLSGPLKKPFSYFVTGDWVKVSAKLHTSPKSKRALKGGVYTGCGENITDDNGIYRLFLYENQTVTTNCTINVNVPSKQVYLASVTVRDVALGGNSSLVSDGTDIPYNSKVMAAAPFELISSQIRFTLQLDQSVENQTFSLLFDHVNKACSSMTKVDPQDGTKLTLPEWQEDLYLTDVDCRWVLEGQDNKVLGVTIPTFDLQHAPDSFVVTDGGSRNSPPLLQAFQGDSDHAKGLVIQSSGKYLWASLSLAELTPKDKFGATVKVHSQGSHLYNNGSISISSNEAAYLLEVEPGKQVLLTDLDYSLKEKSHLLVYTDFSRSSPLLQDLTSNSPKYPIVSTGNRMLLLSSGFQSSGSGSDYFKANFTAVEPGCHDVTLGTHGFYSLSGNCKASCSWVVRPPPTANNGKLLVALSHLNLGSGGNLSLSTLDQKPLLKANCSSSSVPPIEVNISDGLYLTVYRGACSGDDTNSTALFGTVSVVAGETATPQLQPHVGYSLHSPRYPNQYPLNSKQSWSFKTNSVAGFHLTFNSFDLKAGHSLTLSRGKTHFSLNGSTLPEDFLVGPELNALFESPAAGGLESGYGFDAVLTPCDKFENIYNQSGMIETPSYPTPVKSDSLYYWSITVPEPKNNTAASVRFSIMYNLTSVPHNISDYLIIYDGNNARSPRISNFSSDLLLSRTRSLLIKYVSSANQTSGVPVRISFDSYYCNISDTCHNTGYCIHSDWLCNGVNDCGDNTDELYCGGVPPPPPPPAPTTPSPSPPSPHTGGGGVSPAAFAVTVVIALLVGIVGTLLAPAAIRRYRAYRYSRFSSVSVTE